MKIILNVFFRYGGMNALSTVITSLADRLTESRQIEEVKIFIYG